MQQRILLLFVGIVLVGLLVAGGAFLEDRTQSPLYEARTSDNVLDNEQEFLLQVALLVQEERYEVEVEPGSSALEAMLAAEAQNSFEFTGIEFPGMGFFVEEINGLRQNPRAGKYWIYYVNGEKAKVGVSEYIVQANDVISWNYEDEE